MKRRKADVGKRVKTLMCVTTVTICNKYLCLIVILILILQYYL